MNKYDLIGLMAACVFDREDMEDPTTRAITLAEEIYYQVTKKFESEINERAEKESNLKKDLFDYACGRWE